VITKVRPPQRTGLRKALAVDQRTPRLLVDVEIAAALVVAAVEVVVSGMPTSAAAFRKASRISQDPGLLDPPLAAGTVQLVGARARSPRIS
jgi:hypothetical protein